MATQFVNNLFGHQDRVCTPLARKRLVLLGLKELNECVEWFHPFIEVFFAPWRDSCVAKVKSFLERNSLFETGDGINVYVEAVEVNGLYFEAIKEFLEAGNSLDVADSIIVPFIEECQKLLDYFRTQDQVILPFTWQMSNQGFHSVQRCRHLLSLLQHHSAQLFKKPPASDGVYVKTAADLLEQFDSLIV